MKMFPVSHKLTENTQYFQDYDPSPHLWWSGCTDDRRSWEGQLRSHDVTIRFSPITSDRTEKETCKWCQTTWLVKPLWNICILTYLGHDLTFTWPDLRLDFEIDISTSESTWSEPARRGEHNGISFIFMYLIKRVTNENHLREKWKLFIWWRLEPKLLSLCKIWSKKLPEHEESSLQCFLTFLAIILLEIITTAVL